MILESDLAFFIHFHYPCQAKSAGVDTNEATDTLCISQNVCQYSFAWTRNAFELDHSNRKLFQTFNMRILWPKKKEIASNWYVPFYRYAQRHSGWKYMGKLKLLHKCVHGRWAASCKRITKLLNGICVVFNIHGHSAFHPLPLSKYK